MLLSPSCFSHSYTISFSTLCAMVPSEVKAFVMVKSLWKPRIASRAWQM